MDTYAPPRMFIAAALALWLAACSYANATPSKSLAVVDAGETSCTDFLTKLNKRPPALQFISCEKVLQYGTPALQASYRVAGADAAAVETYLVKSARMPQLRYLCCGWETVSPSPKSRARTGLYVERGQRFEVTMTSGESTVNRRQRWPEIAYFHVKVTTYTQSP